MNELEFDRGANWSAFGRTAKSYCMNCGSEVWEIQIHRCGKQPKSGKVEISGKDWDAVEKTPKARADYLRARGVPIDEDGCWMPNFEGMECRATEDGIKWVYYWHED